LSGAGRPGPGDEHDTIRRGIRVERRPGERLRLPIPSREEPAGGPPHTRELQHHGARGARVNVLAAIDLRGGRCVRLFQGSFARETVYDDDPVRVARRWEAEGAPWLHVVDLDGARAGHPV